MTNQYRNCHIKPMASTYFQACETTQSQPVIFYLSLRRRSSKGWEKEKNIDIMNICDDEDEDNGDVVSLLHRRLTEMTQESFWLPSLSTRQPMGKPGEQNGCAWSVTS